MKVRILITRAVYCLGILQFTQITLLESQDYLRQALPDIHLMVDMPMGI